MSSRPPESERPSGDQAREELRQARQEAGKHASEAAEAAKGRGREEFDSAKRDAAEKADKLADAIDRTADDFGSSDDAISGYGHSMASMMRRLAGGLRENDIEDFAGEVAKFARRNPGSFLAGSVALGFGLSRVLKASSSRSAHEYGDDDEELAFDDFDDEYLGEEFGAEQRSPLRSSTTDLGSSPDVETHSAERWPEAPESPVAGSEYSTDATGEPAGNGGKQERDELGGTHRE